MVNPRALKHYIAIDIATHSTTLVISCKCRTLKLLTLIVSKQLAEIVTWRCFVKGLFWKSSQNLPNNSSQPNYRASV